jgi:tetratricopeptide (TPR) repeat protein
VTIRRVVSEVGLGSVLAIVLLSVFAPAVVAGEAGSAAGEETAQGSTDDEAAARRARARARLAGLDEEGDDDGAYAGAAGSRGGLGALFSRGSGLLGTGVMALAFYFLFMRGRGAQGNNNWGSYYLFWIVAPALVAVVTSHPSALILVVVGLVARRWLPDPYLALKHSARIRKLAVEAGTNPGNVTARRDLAAIWLEKRRPQRALPLLDQALERDPGSVELLFLRGMAELYSKCPERALEAFLAVVHTTPGFRYGEGYLRAADALVEMNRLDDAEEALDRYLKVNSSSIEALFKLARVRTARKDEAGAEKARKDLRDVWHLLPAFQRRNQRGWYLRARLSR